MKIQIIVITIIAVIFSIIIIVVIMRHFQVCSSRIVRTDFCLLLGRGRRLSDCD